MRRQIETLAQQAAQIALANAPKPQAPAGMDPAFFEAMVRAGAAPFEATNTPGIGDGLPGNLPASSVGRRLDPFPQQAPVMSQVSPAPAMPAMANVNNNVTMPMPTFTPAAQRPQLPQFQPQGLSPNLGAYAQPPSMPGYGMPRQSGPFKAPPMPSFANFGYNTQPTAQQPDQSLYGGMGPGMVDGRGLNLFNRY